jgi:hypothetical protein
MVVQRKSLVWHRWPLNGAVVKEEGGGSGLEHQVARRGGGPDRRVVMAGSNPLPADAGDAWQGDSRQWR